MNSNNLTDRKKRHGYLQECCRRYGDFLVSTHSKDPITGDEKWTKHVSVLYCWEHPEEWWRLETANNRTPFECELIIDFDPEGRYNNTIEVSGQEESRFLLNRALKAIKCGYLQHNYWNVRVFFSGSRGYHIHCIMPHLASLPRHRREAWRQKILSSIDADEAKKSEHCMISLEYTPHWKSGKLKEEIEWSKAL